MGKKISKYKDIRIFGRWINHEIEYIFNSNNSFWVIFIDKEIEIKGQYFVLNNIINLTYNNYQTEWKGFIEYVDEEKLLIRDLTNEIGKVDNLTKMNDVFTLKKIPPDFNSNNIEEIMKKIDYFPQLLINQEVLDSLKKTKFQKPSEPIFNEEKPTKNYGFILYILITIIGLILFINTPRLLILSLILIFLGSYLLIKNPNKKKYNNDLNKYERLKKLHENKIISHKKIISLNNQEYNLLKRKENIKLTLGKKKYSITEDYKNGLSHDFFKIILFDYFGEKNDNKKGILEGLSYFKNRYFNDSNFKPYVTDFAYVDDNINLVIIIEVDEPYTFDSKKPIHLNDKERNSFFQDLNWIIIRFSEEQVITYPYDCCNFINEVAEKFYSNDYNPFIKNNLPFIQKWDSYNIERMINSNYRENYIRKKLFH